MGIAFSGFNLYARRFRPVKVPLDWLAFSTGLLLWPIATLASCVSVGVALALYTVIVLFYVALPILREDRVRPVASVLAGPNPIALGCARAAKPNGGDLGEDA